MKKASIITIVLTLVMISFAGAVDFSGTWILDESKLEATEGPMMEAAKMTIEQKDNSMVRDRFMSNPMMGDFTVNETMTLDGEVNESETEFGLRKITATWSEDKKALTVESSIKMNWDGQEMEMKGTEVMSLDKDDVIKIISTRTSPMGDMETTIYYNKEK